MVCYNPLHGFKGPRNENGKRPIVFREKDSLAGVRQDVPCGRCVGCRLRYAKSWSVRCMHEAAMHRENSFITLTFNDANLPDDGSLDVRHTQLFMKRLRKWRFVNGLLSPIKFMFAGEYGGDMGRAHYHGLLFGHDFADKLFEVERFGNRVYSSVVLGKLWPFGFHSVGDFSPTAAAYVARYCLKKVTGDDANEHYVVKDTGVLRRPEFTVMSRGGRQNSGGIGASWYAKFKDDVFPSDEVIFNGRPDKPPRYYDNLLDKQDPDLLESLKLVRACFSKRDSTDERLRVREFVARSNIRNLVRPLEG